MAATAAADPISNTFNAMSGAIDDMTKFAMKGLKWGSLLVIGALLTEPVIFCISHYNMGGASLMSVLSNMMNPYLDSFGVTDFLHSTAEVLAGGSENMVKDVGAALVNNPNGAPVLAF